jgi:hypothetical protein
MVFRGFAPLPAQERGEKLARQTERMTGITDISLDASPDNFKIQSWQKFGF